MSGKTPNPSIFSWLEFNPFNFFIIFINTKLTRGDGLVQNRTLDHSKQGYLATGKDPDKVISNYPHHDLNDMEKKALFHVQKT